MTSTAPPWLYAPAWQRATAALKAEQPGDFVEAVEELLTHYPDDPILLYNSAVILVDLGRLDTAVQRYDHLRQVAPAMRPRAVCGLLRAAQLSGSFESAERATAAAVELLERQLDTIDDVPLLKYFAYRRVFTPALDRFGPALGTRIARLLGAPALPAPSARPERGRRLTVGYLSWGFGDHPIGHVTQDLFAAHDRDRFRILGFSGRDRSAEAAPYARKIRAGFDACHEIGGLSPVEAARRIRAANVDILVALDQHMAWDGQTSAPEILAHRPAPLQASWLGVAASAHLPFIDVLLADAVTVPAGEDTAFTERVVRLPGCFHCASPHPIAAEAPSRAECGLPDAGPVFAGFNNIEKIDRASFDAWMAILRQVPDSVLWLTHRRQIGVTEANLRREAEARGVAGNRLVFAGRLPDKSLHLARHRHADLLLDTLSLNASTTALDALWAGLPVLTVQGSRFAARLAETFLRHAGLPELVMPDVGHFIALAAALAQDRARLAQLKARVARQGTASGLFDTAGFARKLEAAYDQLWRDRPGS